jgi:hypothetical protein
MEYIYFDTLAFEFKRNIPLNTYISNSRKSYLVYKLSNYKNYHKINNLAYILWGKQKKKNNYFQNLKKF